MQRDVEDTVKLCIFVGGNASHRGDLAKEYRDVSAAWRLARKAKKESLGQWWGQQSWGSSRRVKK